MLATDERILPSTDSHSDLAFDDDPLPSCHVPSAHLDKVSEGYAPGHACHRPPFLQPSDSEAQPLRHSITDSTAINGNDGCHGGY